MQNKFQTENSTLSSMIEMANKRFTNLITTETLAVTSSITADHRVEELMKKLGDLEKEKEAYK